MEFPNQKFLNFPKILIEFEVILLLMNLKSSEFPDDSQLETIEKDAFCDSTIECINIPSKCIDLKDGWRNKAYQLKTIKVADDNPKYSNVKF